MIPTIHLDLHREAVQIRVSAEAEDLVLVRLTQGVGELTLRLRHESALSLALALASALREGAGEQGEGARGVFPVLQEIKRPARPEGAGDERRSCDEP